MQSWLTFGIWRKWPWEVYISTTKVPYGIAQMLDRLRRTFILIYSNSIKYMRGVPWSQKQKNEYFSIHTLNQWIIIMNNFGPGYLAVGALMVICITKAMENMFACNAAGATIRNLYLNAKRRKGYKWVWIPVNSEKSFTSASDDFCYVTYYNEALTSFNSHDFSNVRIPDTFVSATQTFASIRNSSSLSSFSLPHWRNNSAGWSSLYGDDLFRCCILLFHTLVTLPLLSEKVLLNTP